MIDRTGLPTSLCKIATACTLFLVAAGSARAGGCGYPVPVAHPRQSADGGAFIISEMAGRKTGPPIRFWAYRQFARANNGNQGQFRPGEEWLPGGVTRPGASPEMFFLDQANWSGPAIAGCFKDAGVDRTVVEISYLFDDGQASHYTGYLIASVKTGESLAFDFDRVADGNGGGSAHIKMEPIPVPRPVGVATVNASDAKFMDVQLQLGSARSYGDAGAPNLIAGYEIRYVNDEPPRTSSIGVTTPVRTPSAPSTPLAIVPFGTSQVTVTVPKPKQQSYFVVALRYVDDTVPLMAMGTSGHSAGVAAPAGSDEPRADSTPEAEATPEETVAETPDEPTATPDSAPTATAGSERGRAAATAASAAAASETGVAVGQAPSGNGNANTPEVGGTATVTSTTVTGGGFRPGVANDRGAAESNVNLFGSENPGGVRPLVNASLSKRPAGSDRAPGSSPGEALLLGLPGMMASSANTGSAAAAVAAAPDGANPVNIDGAIPITSPSSVGDDGGSSAGSLANASSGDAAGESGTGSATSGSDPFGTGADGSGQADASTASQTSSSLPPTRRAGLWTMLDVMMALSIAILGVVVWLGRR